MNSLGSGVGGQLKSSWYSKCTKSGVQWHVHMDDTAAGSKSRMMSQNGLLNTLSLNPKHP